MPNRLNGGERGNGETLAAIITCAIVAGALFGAMTFWSSIFWDILDVIFRAAVGAIIALVAVVILWIVYAMTIGRD